MGEYSRAYSSHTYLWNISCISRSKSQPFFKSFSLGRQVFSLYQIQRIQSKFWTAFSKTSLCKIALKNYHLLSSLFSLISLRYIVSLIFIWLPERRTANIPRVPIESLMLAIKENLSIVKLKSVIWAPIWFRLDKRFFIGSLLSLYQTQGLITICASVTDVALYTSKEEQSSVGHKKISNNDFVFLSGFTG